MVNYCQEYEQSVRGPSKRERKAKERNPEEPKAEEVEILGKRHRAYICPNAGATNNLSSNKQRLIFMEIDRNDVYSVLDVGKVADIILMVMSTKNIDETQLKIDPDKSSGAIDEQGYRSLGLLRSQGLVSLVGVL